MWNMYLHVLLLKGHKTFTEQLSFAPVKALCSLKIESRVFVV